jgi:predicted dehydrogenase
MVGHIERFNPSWQAVRNANFRPRFVDVDRLSRFPFRSLDVSVVFDVMIHDIDLVRAVARSKVRKVEAIGSASISPSLDWASVRIEFENHTLANLYASRIHHTTERKMTLRSERASLEIDFLRRTSTHHQLAAGARELLGRNMGSLTSEEKELMWREMSIVHVEAHAREVEPLRLELEEFVSSIREGRDPTVTGEDGLESVVIATDIERAIANTQFSHREAA